MAKFSGVIGFARTVATSEPGVFEEEITERLYFGEVTRDALQVITGQTVLGEDKTTNSFRIVADGYATENFMDMTYVLWGGVYWAVTAVVLGNRPRLTVRIGGRYNGPTGATPHAPGAP